MKTRVIAGTMLLALSILFSMIGTSEGAQEPNPLFLEARNLWQQLSASRMPADEKATYGKRFGDLARVQRQLWDFAGQVDSGACADQCLDDYNNRVMYWQSDLETFNSDARSTLEASKQEKGVWKPFGKFTHGNLGICRQVWYCGPQGQIVRAPDMKIVATPMQTLTGFCSIKDNPENCGECSASWGSGPEDSCEWHLEKR